MAREQFTENPTDRQKNIENFEQITQWKTTKWKEQWYIKSLLALFAISQSFQD